MRENLTIDEQITNLDIIEFGHGVDGNFNGFYIQPKIMKLSYINSHADITDFIKKVEIIMKLNKVLLE